jgi:adenylylsulfate kinase
MKKLLVMGLPGAGKTTLANVLAARLNAVHFNADDVRTHINKDLGFSIADRVEHATRMGWLCDRVTSAGSYVIADFICPTDATRCAFMKDARAFVIWVDRIGTGRFEDTNALFEPPQACDMHVTTDGAPEYWAERITDLVCPVFDPKKATALFVGRYQPFHRGHYELIVEGIRRVGQACIAIRDTSGTDDKNPFSLNYVRSRIDIALHDYRGRFKIVDLPNISHVFYGRDVGYRIERIDLDEDVRTISATKVRERMGATVTMDHARSA